MLCCGDIHGNYEKAKAFLEYKPEIPHCFVGDYTDSFVAEDDTIIKTMEMIFNSDAICLAGNHDNQYFMQSPRWTLCSGYRLNTSMKFVEVMEKYKHRIKACHVDNDYFICHGGITPEFGRAFDSIEQMEAYCNKEFNSMIYSDVTMISRPPIFNVGRFRGGPDMYSGIFWASYGFEELDTRFNIVCGHTHRSFFREEYVGDDHSKHHVCVDCDQFVCFNTETRLFESFFPKDKLEDKDILERAW